MASDALSLNQVEDFTRAGPDEFDMGRFTAQQRHRFGHEALDERVAVEGQNLVPVRAIGE